jgi:Family of unknown function (DUF6334)
MMTDLASEIDSLGALTGSSVRTRCRRRIAPATDEFNEYVFRFGPDSLAVTAVPADDTISLTFGGATLPHVEDLTADEPWSRLIGCDVVWMWRLINHRNYVDGCQFEFGRPGEIWTLQLMCMASELSASSWSALEKMHNQYRRFEPRWGSPRTRHRRQGSACSTRTSSSATALLTARDVTPRALSVCRARVATRARRGNARVGPAAPLDVR